MARRAERRPATSGVEFEVRGRVALLTLNRPEKLNAMDSEMYEAISGHLRRIDADDEIWAGVVTGSGDRAFTAGADLVGLHGTAEAARPGWSSPRADRFDLGLEVQKPLIAAVNGYCLAGGLELALVCDIRVAAENAQFGCPEVKWNLLHGYGAQRLPEIVGFSNAMYLLLTGRFVDAREALRIGLVQEVVPVGGALPRALELAEAICANGPLAVRVTKELALRSRDLSLPDGIRLYQALGRLVEMSEDQEEGTRAFAEKRSPRFRNR
jgi:enoyl-CoA hydratase/carnithine racemase